VSVKIALWQLSEICLVSWLKETNKHHTVLDIQWKVMCDKHEMLTRRYNSCFS